PGVRRGSINIEADPRRAPHGPRRVDPRGPRRPVPGGSPGSATTTAAPDTAPTRRAPAATSRGGHPPPRYGPEYYSTGPGQQKDEVSPRASNPATAMPLRERTPRAH